jgi:flagellin
MVSIHSNSVQLRVSNQLSRQGRSLDKSVSRLVSGQRLQSAADNSAGQAIVTKVKALTRSRRVAQRNIQHARNLCNMADGGISSIKGMVTKLRQLAVQSASDNINAKERQFVHKEAVELLTSIDDVALTTKISEEQPLLYKTPIDIGFVVDTSGSMGGVINDVRTHISGFTADMAERGFNIAFGLVRAGQKNDGVDGADQVADIGSPDFNTELNKLTAVGQAVDNYSAVLEAAVTDRAGVNEPDQFSWRQGSHRYIILVTDTTGNTEVNFFGDTESEVATALANANIGFHAIVNVSGDYDDIANQTGGTIQGLNNVETALDNIEVDIDEDLESIHNMTFQIGIHNESEDQVKSDLAVDVTRLGLGIEKINFTTRENAQNAIDSLDLALDELNLNATKIGSLTNSLTRMEMNQGVTIVNEEEARSTIEDTDMAVEATSFSIARMMREGNTQLLNVYKDLQASSVVNLIEGSVMSDRSIRYR